LCFSVVTDEPIVKKKGRRDSKKSFSPSDLGTEEAGGGWGKRRPVGITRKGGQSTPGTLNRKKDVGHVGRGR